MGSDNADRQDASRTLRPSQATPLYREAGARLSAAFVTANRQEAVLEIIGRHFEERDAHRQALDALVAEIRSALAQPTDLAAIRERLLGAVAKAPVEAYPVIECEAVL